MISPSSDGTLPIYRYVKDLVDGSVTVDTTGGDTTAHANGYARGSVTTTISGGRFGQDPTGYLAEDLPCCVNGITDDGLNYEVVRGYRYAGALIAYGTQAQNEFDYNVAVVETMAKLKGTSEKPCGTWEADAAAGVSEGYEDKVGVSLSLKERIELNIYVESAQTEQISVALDGTQLTQTEDYTVSEAAEGVVRVTLHSINVGDVKKTAVVTVGDCTVTYGIEEYVLLAQQSGSQTELMTALQKYVDSVCAYLSRFANQWVTPGPDETEIVLLA